MTLGALMTTDGVFDPTAHAHLLHQVFEAVLAGDRTPVAPRTLVSESWQRSLAAHVDPDKRTPPVVVEESEIPHLRTAHPAMKQLVSATAQLAEHQLRVRLAIEDERLRVRNMPHLASLRGEAGALVTSSGRVVAGEPYGVWPERVHLHPGADRGVLDDGR